MENKEPTLEQITCPNCGIKFNSQHQWSVRNDRTILCPYCGNKWQVEEAK